MLMPKFAINGFLTEPHFHPEDGLEGLFGEFCPLLQYPYPLCCSSLVVCQGSVGQQLSDKCTAELESSVRDWP